MSGQAWPSNAKVAGAYKENGQNKNLFIAFRLLGRGSGVFGYAYENETGYFGWYGKEIESDAYWLFVEED